MSNKPRQMTGQEHSRDVKSSKIPKLRGTEYSAFIAAVLGWNSTTHY